MHKRGMTECVAYWGVIGRLGSTEEMPGVGSCGAISARGSLFPGHAACAVAHTLQLERPCVLLNTLPWLS